MPFGRCEPSGPDAPIRPAPGERRVGSDASEAVPSAGQERAADPATHAGAELGRAPQPFVLMIEPRVTGEPARNPIPSRPQVVAHDRLIPGWRRRETATGLDSMSKDGAA